MNIDFQPVESAEIDQLLTFIRDFCEYDGHPFDEAALRVTIQTLIQHPDWGGIWFICRDQEPVGYVVLTLGYSLEYLGRDAFVDEIYIRESDRAQGIGKMTFQFLEKTCRELGVKALHLEVEHANTNAQVVYRKLGFVDQQRYLMTRRFGSEES